MKPRLIKFSCPACDARLAVPGAMAGMEDNCPKCGARIKAPIPQREPAPDIDPASPGTVAPDLTPVETARKATPPAKPRESVAVPKVEREAFRSTLFDEFLSTPPHPPKEPDPAPAVAAVETPAPEAPKVRFKATKPPKTVKPVEPPAIEPVLIPAPVAVPAPETVAADPPSAPLTLLERIASTEPKPVLPPVDDEPTPMSAWEAPPGEMKADFGMGEMLAEQSSAPLPPGTRHVLPSLGVGLIQLEDTPRHYRKLRRRRATVVGILLFLAFDAAVFGWVFRRRIADWWQERSHAEVPQPVVASPVRAVPVFTMEASPPSASSPAEPPSTTLEPSIAEQPPTAAGPGPSLTGKMAEPPTPTDPPIALPDVNTLLLATLQSKPGPEMASLPKIDPPLPVGPASPVSPPPDATQPPPAIPPAPPQPETPAPTPVDSSMAKTEVTPPPLPPPLPPGAEIPGAPEKLTTTEPAPTPPEPTTEDSASSTAKIAEANITKASRPALDALKSFLAAPTWQERIRWVQKPDTIKAAMERHYKKHPDGPVNVTRIEFIERYPARGSTPAYCMFEIKGGSLKRSQLVLVEEKTKTDFRVDWEAFVEFKDQLLWEFLIKPGSPPEKFRVMIRRNHYFDKDVPDLSRKDAFELSQPGADTIANVFAIKGGSAAKTLSQQLGWGESIAVTVQLTWHGEGDRGWVEIKSVPAFGWRG